MLPFPFSTMMKAYLLLFLIQLLYKNIFVQAAKSALCFLTVQPSFETLEIADELAQDGIDYGVDVYVMVDDNNFKFSSLDISSYFRFLNISTKESYSHNYHQTSHLGANTSNVTSWDKALYYFCVLNTKYSFVWLIEDDVFIPSVQAFRSINQLYSDVSDLVIPRIGYNLLGNTSTWYWPHTYGRFPPPWAASMVNFVGFSRRMLKAMHDNNQWHGESAFHEFFFLTLAIQLNMAIVTPLELSTIVYRQQISGEQLYAQPNNFWHPMKRSSDRLTWRDRLTDAGLGRNPIVKLIDLGTLRYNKGNMSNVVEHLTKFLINFEKRKSKLSPNTRRSLRQYFLNLAKQCQKYSNSEEAVSLAQKLADHAYKVPEYLLILFEQKSSKHLKLEQELVQNKQAIFDLLSSTNSNVSCVNNLRQIAKSLIIELTLEIRREAKEQQEHQNQNQFLPIMREINTFSLLPSFYQAKNIIDDDTSRLSSPGKYNNFALFKENYLKKLLFIWLILFVIIVILRFRKVIQQKVFRIVYTFMDFFLSYFCMIYFNMFNVQINRLSD